MCMSENKRMTISVEFETEEQAKAWAIQLVKQSKREIPSNLFRDVQFSAEELLEINNEYDFVIEQAKVVAHSENMANFIYLDELILSNSGTSFLTIDAWSIHDLMRKLSLAVYGVRNNKDMNKKDFEQAKEFYLKIKNLFLTEYGNRLEKNTERSIKDSDGKKNQSL